MLTYASNNFSKTGKNREIACVFFYLPHKSKLIFHALVGILKFCEVKNKRLLSFKKQNNDLTAFLDFEGHQGYKLAENAYGFDFICSKIWTKKVTNVFPVTTSLLQDDTTNGEDTTSESELRKSLETAVEESLKTKLDEEFSKTQAELESLAHTNFDLLDNQEELNRLESDLDEKMAQCEEENDELRSCNRDLNQSLAELEGLKLSETSVEVEGKLHNQILNTYAEDMAFDDAIYMLGEGFRMGRIPCEVYLKRVRNLSRKQFFTRALLEKCREKAGIPDEIE